MRPRDEVAVPPGFVAPGGGPSASEAPITLTSPEGIALELRQLHAETVVDGPLAHTELRLAFRNPEPRTIEGRFRIALPPGASLARLAMQVNGSWQEGEVLERKLATFAYEDSLHRRVDPALLEAGAGNTFSARIFPIGAGEVKRIVIGYSQVVTSANQVVVPLRGLAPVADARATVWRGGLPSETRLTSFGSDVLFGSPAELTGDGDARRSGELVALRVKPVVAGEPEPVASLVVLVDTSASRALDVAADLDALRGLAGKLAARPEAQLAVIAFDQSRELVFNGTARDFGTPQLERLRRRQALGASDLGRALSFAGEVARAHHIPRVLLIGDGVRTTGSQGAALVAIARDLAKQGVARLDALAVGGLRDEANLHALVTAGLPHAGLVVTPALGMDLVWDRLEQSVRDKVTLDIEGATWIHPRGARGLVAGEDLVVFARLPENQRPVLRVDGRAIVTPEPSLGDRDMLERAAAVAEIDGLIEAERRDGATLKLRSKITALSTRHRVVSPYTALLVLESEADYARLNLARSSLSPITTVEGGKLAHARRAPPAVIAEARPSSPSPSGRLAEGSAGRAGTSARGPDFGDAADRSFGAGGLGLSGIGAGGGGRGPSLSGLGAIGAAPAARTDGPATTAKGTGTRQGFGAGFGTGAGRLSGSHRTSRGPLIRPSMPDVSVAMPAEVVHRIVRQSYGRLRLSYEQALDVDPSLVGELHVFFGIASSGAVLSVSVSGPGPRSFHEAIGRAYWAMSFPETDGAAVTVHQRIQFGHGPTSGPTSTTMIARPSFPLGEPNNGTSERVATPAPKEVEPHEGTYADVMHLLDQSQLKDAMVLASEWHAREPGEALALIALGEAMDRSGHDELAARAYGSLIDLFPDRVDVLRYAASRLLRVKNRVGVDLALESFASARKDRPDHATGHRLHAYALLRDGRHAESFAALRDGYVRDYPNGRFEAVKQVLASDLGLVAAAWRAARPADAPAIARALGVVGVEPDNEPSRRFVLSWESDANDVDLHVFDELGGHAWYSSQHLPSGGRLLADVTTGYGPEMFVVRGAEAAGHTYRLAAHYFARGPMGFGMGRVQVIDHDGLGHVAIEDRPFEIMKADGMVSLGSVPPRG
ncbi:MAG: hypothetical protein FJ096_03295 [Deltaproteobacteria bacterium]|nr:hypothetical protein [Deltaproteobacteria bacterium]